MKNQNTYDFLFPKRNIYLAVESGEHFDQAQQYESLATKMGAEYVPISSGVIKFEKGDTLAKRVMDIYKTENGIDEKKARASALLIAAKMARAAKDQNLPGFDVDTFNVGDEIAFLGNDKVKVEYTPRGSKERTTATLDLSDEAAHTGVIHETREALKGTRLDVFEEALKRVNVYNVANSLGYSWGKAEDQKEFTDKVKSLGYNGKSNAEMCKFIQGEIAKDNAENVFNKLKSGVLAEMDASAPFVVPAGVERHNEAKADEEGLRAPETATATRVSTSAEVVPQEPVAEQQAEEALDFDFAPVSAEEMLGETPQQPVELEKTKEQQAKQALLESERTEIGKAEVALLERYSGYDYTLSRVYSSQEKNKGMLIGLKLTFKNAETREKEEAEVKITKAGIFGKITAYTQDGKARISYKGYERESIEAAVMVAAEDLAKKVPARTVEQPVGEPTPEVEGEAVELAPATPVEPEVAVAPQEPAEDIEILSAEGLIEVEDAVDATTLDALQQDWDANIKPKIVDTLAKYNTAHEVEISFDATSDVKTLPNGARIATLHLGDKTIDIRFKAPRDGKGYDSRMIYVGTGVSYGDVESAVIAKADMLVKRAGKKLDKAAEFSAKLKTTLQDSLRGEFPDVEVVATRNPYSSNVSVTMYLGEEFGSVNNLTDPENLEVWKENALEVARKLKAVAYRGSESASYEGA